LSLTMPLRRVSATSGGAARVVAIIGAGFSGTMAANHLRRALPADHVVYLFDKTGRFAT
jgi:cation diffusion facilitator CzcD-associated flavoprotein CzcO